jgi:exosortase/archaeosortase family protein
MEGSGKKGFVVFLVKFIGIFLLLYYGSLGVVGITAPGGGYHSEFVSEYLDFVKGIQTSLILGAHYLLYFFGIDTSWTDEYRFFVVGGKAVIVYYGCAGLGVMSFWIAFILAGTTGAYRKFLWLIGGLLLLWFINVCRIALFLMAVNNGWPMPFGVDHHTWFNIVAYGAIFILILFHERSAYSNLPSKKEPS